jgi:hypothetical protein
MDMHPNFEQHLSNCFNEENGLSLNCSPEFVYIAADAFFLYITATIPAPATARMIIRLEVTSATGPNVYPRIGHPVIIDISPGENTKTAETGGYCGVFYLDIGWLGSCSATYTVKSAHFEGGPDIPSAIGQSVSCVFYVP